MNISKMTVNYIVSRDGSVAVYNNVTNGFWINGVNTISNAKLIDGDVCIPFTITNTKKWNIPGEFSTGVLLSVENGIATIMTEGGEFLVKISKLRSVSPGFIIGYDSRYEKRHPRLEFHFEELTWTPRLDITIPRDHQDVCYITLLAEVTNKSYTDVSGGFTFVLKQDQRAYRQRSRSTTSLMVNESYDTRDDMYKPTIYNLDHLVVKDVTVCPLRRETVAYSTVEIIEFKYMSVEESTTTSYLMKSPFFIPNITANISDADRYNRDIPSVNKDETFLIPIRSSETYTSVVKYQTVTIDEEGEVIEHFIEVQTNAPIAVLKIHNRNRNISDLSNEPDIHIRDNLLIILDSNETQVHKIKFRTTG